MPELTQSMREKYDQVYSRASNLGYMEQGGISPFTRWLEVNDPEAAIRLWSIIDGTPDYFYRWLNGRGSLSWILFNTPELAESLLDADLADLTKLEATYKDWEKTHA